MAAVARPAPPAPAAASTSARAILSDLLGQFGLQALASWAWETYVGAGGGDLGMQLVQADLPQTAEFKARFPAIEARTKAGLPAITPAAYLSYEQTIRQAFLAHGLALPTTGGQFNDMISRLLTHDVSASEVVNDRIGTAFDRVANAPVEVKQAAEQLWGIHGDQALASFFLSPEHSAPELERLSKSMSVAGTAARYGISVDTQRAGRLADLGAADHLDRMAQIVQMAPLFRSNVGESGDLTAAGAGLSAAYGEDATSQAAITRRLQERQAMFAGGGAPSENRAVASKGLGGLGAGPEG